MKESESNQTQMALIIQGQTSHKGGETKARDTQGNRDYQNKTGSQTEENGEKDKADSGKHRGT